MSSRALRRAQGDALEQLLAAHAHDSDSSDEALPRRTNPFALNMLDGVDSDEGKDKGKDKDEDEDADTENVSDTSPSSAEARSDKRTRPKRLSRKMKKRVQRPEQPPLEDEEELEDMAISAAHANEQHNESSWEAATEIFQVDLDHLDPAAELRRRIGGLDKELATSPSSLPDGALQRGIRSAGSSRVRRYRRQLVTPRATWTKVTAALVELRLERIGGHELYGSAAFRFVPLDTYDAQFEEFCELVELGDIELIYAFARKYPLHVDALLVVSDYMRMSSASDALELTERAVYILEKCTLATSETGVDLTAGSLRLPYDEFDNRRMHLALLRYIQFLAKNGCYRTALEYAKILWSLDPLLDPVGVRMIADMLAIQAGQYEWFDAVYQRQVRPEAAWLANWHFSHALLQFTRGRRDDADNLLQYAILENPWMVPRLAESCGIQMDESSWRTSFAIPVPSRSDHVGPLREALAKVYAQRMGPVWKSQRNRAWLESALGVALSHRLSSAETRIDMIDYRPSIMEAASVLRHAMISDLPNVQVALPTSIAPTVGHLYDPLPPEILADVPSSASRCTLQ